MSIYKYKLDKWEGGSTTSLFVPYEQEGDVYFGVLLEVSWHQDVYRPLEFISICIRRDGVRINPFRANHG